jgi:transposase
LDILELINTKIDDTNNCIDPIATDDPEIRLAMTMPGIGHFAATSFVGEVGDIRRFKDGDHLAAFTGLVPRVHQSGNTCKLGSITKQGNTNLRWVMIQAANVAVQHDPYLKKIYLNLLGKKGHSKAVTAVARRMVTYLYAMLTNNIAYHALQIHKVT